MTDESPIEASAETVAVEAKKEVENTAHSKLAEIYAEFKAKIAEAKAWLAAEIEKL